MTSEQRNVLFFSDLDGIEIAIRSVSIACGYPEITSNSERGVPLSAGCAALAIAPDARLT